MNTSILSPIEKYRQLKREIRKGQDILIVGIDIGKHSSVSCIGDTSGKIYLRKYKFGNHLRGIQDIISRAEEYKGQHRKSSMVWAVEPTGNYHKPVANHLIRNGYRVVGISSVTAKENRKTLDGGGRWRKNDPRDAFNILDLVRQGKMFFYQENPEREGLKDLLKLRMRTSKSLSSFKARIRNNHFARYFPEIDSLYPDIFNQDIMRILKHCPTAEDIRQLSYQRFLDILMRKKASLKHERRLHEVWQRAQDSIGCVKHSSVNLTISIYLENILQLKSQIKTIDKNIRNFCCESRDYDLIQGIPGYGPLLTAVIMAYVGPIDNYEHPDQLSKLAGLDLEYVQSGQFHGQACISKKGSSLLRYAVCSAALHALKNKTIRQYFETQLQRKGSESLDRAKLRIKLAEKLLRTIFIILKTREPFSLQRFANPVTTSLCLST